MSQYEAGNSISDDVFVNLTGQLFNAVRHWFDAVYFHTSRSEGELSVPICCHSSPGRRNEIG